MKLGFTTLIPEGSERADIEDDILTFNVSQPVIIQSSEIQKVKTGIALKVSKGHVLCLSTHFSLAEKAGEIFPASRIIDHTDRGELLIAVRNSGRNPLHLMQGQLLAKGVIIKIVKVETEKLERSETLEMPRVKTKPQKKNPFQFEIK